MKKIIFALLILVFSILVSSTKVLANKSSPTPFPSSYELFYPVTAGKIPGEKLYFLKVIREWIVDKLISDPIKNSDYHLTLSKKRLVEGEKLINIQEYQLAEKSITNSLKEIKRAIASAKKAQTRGKNPTDIFNTIKVVAKNESDFIEVTLTKSVPDSQKQFYFDSSKGILDLTQKL